jgi:small subunit ribosomal protein S16
MLAIKLSRTGKKKQPYYRIIVLEKHKDPWGDYKELLGNYNPRTKELVIKEDRLKYWISVGAQMSNTVHNLMNRKNIIEDKPKKSVTISKKRTVKLAEKNKEKEEAKAEKKEKEANDAKKDEEVKEAPAEEKKEEVTEEKKEDKPAEKVEEAKVEDKKEEKVEEVKEDVEPTKEEKAPTEETVEEDKK